MVSDVVQQCTTTKYAHILALGCWDRRRSTSRVQWQLERQLQYASIDLGIFIRDAFEFFFEIGVGFDQLIQT
jgi:hypothetical protein